MDFRWSVADIILSSLSSFLFLFLWTNYLLADVSTTSTTRHLVSVAGAQTGLPVPALSPFDLFPMQQWQWSLSNVRLHSPLLKTFQRCPCLRVKLWVLKIGQALRTWLPALFLFSSSTTFLISNSLAVPAVMITTTSACACLSPSHLLFVFVWALQ